MGCVPYSAGGTSPIDVWSRRWLNQSTHSGVANSTATDHFRLIQADHPLGGASYESPTLPTDDSIPASASRSVYRIERYWVHYRM